MSEEGKSYRLGRRLVRLMHAALRPTDIQTLAEPTLTRLVRQFGQVFYINQLIAGRVRLVAFVLPGTTERALIVPGEYSPIHATATGKAIFAFESQETIERELRKPLTRFQPNTLVDPPKVRAELARVRERGYAMTQSEFEMGVTAIAVPIEIPNAGVLFSVGVAGFDAQMFEKHSKQSYIAALQDGATELQAVLSPNLERAGRRRASL
jgi:DNA-binding IclR family transcriptional regulator